MHLKSQLICEDARFELGGTLTLVGVQREVVSGIGGKDGPSFARLMFVSTVCGLSGVGALACRHTLRALDAAHSSREQPLCEEAHDSELDEHTFLFGNAPFSFPTPGRYEIALEPVVPGQPATFRYPFRVESLRRTRSGAGPCTARGCARSDR